MKIEGVGDSINSFLPITKYQSSNPSPVMAEQQTEFLVLEYLAFTSTV